MSIYKRGSTWWLQITGPNGERIQRSIGTKDERQAQEYHDRLKAELWRVKNLGERQRRTWQEAVIRWITEMSHKKSLDEDKIILRWLDPYLGAKMLDEIDGKLIADLIYIRRKEGVTNARINRMLALTRAILNKAKNEWDWLDAVPNIKMLQEPKGRLRWLTHEEAHRLLRALPPHLEAIARFALATGLRESNITGLKWSQIDMQRRCAWIHADEAKGKKAIPVPLNEDAIAVILQQLNKHQEYVFTYLKNPVKKAGVTGWRNALKKAGIEDFTFHGLRHTWASWHIQNGTPVTVLKELGGWSDIKMVLRYSHLSADHLSEYADNVKLKQSNVIKWRKSE